MIKLVAADMDGTLLNSKKELSPNLFETINKLKEKNVKFAIASGRQYYNLLKIFEEIKNDLIFISDNGSIVFEGEESIFISEIDEENLIEPIQLIRKMDNVYPILCGEKSAYVENDDTEFLYNAKMYYEHLEIVENILEVINKDRICKIAVYDGNGAEKNSYPKLKKFSDKLLVCLSGENWVDFMNLDINKGQAIKRLQEIYSISYDECMAFGDYLNDYEMMQECKHSYAMANAHPKLKEVCSYEAKSNDEDGVVEALNNYLTNY
ncbi:HAD family hydrolase [Romboutsia sp. 1001713B170207_170306_H8]|uniref:HAD family hydrolase n=1 Tax=Romboutsia sp. 1001713B170207_170306_H8 TaxID=2787112 RepID=UPI00082266A9|nr:HAD family hydrolase [Romboutsia sp. 1001713B170207_170306_H8]SCH98155.1 Phosphatase YbjI [uncultured Clostridium sp.]